MKLAGRWQESRGSILLEVVIVLAIIAGLAAVVVPGMMKFYRETALEYESECLMADLRRSQALSRMVVEQAWGYGQPQPYGQSVSMYVEAEYYTMSVKSYVGSMEKIHRYLPLIHVKRNDRPFGTSSGNISFLQNGRLVDIGSQMMTLVMYCDGWEDEGRKIMISRGGRIRMTRRMK